MKQWNRIQLSIGLFVIMSVFVLLMNTCAKTIVKRNVKIKVCDSVYNRPISGVVISLWQADDEMFWTGCESVDLYTDENGEVELNWRPCFRQTINIWAKISKNYTDNSGFASSWNGPMYYQTSISRKDLKTFGQEDIILKGKPIKKIDIHLMNLHYMIDGDRISVFSEPFQIQHYGQEEGVYPIKIFENENIEYECIVESNGDFTHYKGTIVYDSIFDNQIRFEY